MVGVPGRSKGCSICRQRKKKCDLLRPACGNCVRGQYICGGYERDMVMIHTDNSGKGTYRPFAKTTYPLWRRSHPQCGTSPVTTLSQSLSRATLELQYIDIFWSLYLLKPVTSSFWRSSSIHHEAKWAKYTSNSAPQSEILKCALSALSVSKVGRDTQDKQLTHRGIELYGKALALLSKELKAPGDVKPFGVLNCCRILALYEQINDVGASAHNWKGHIRGLLNLVRLHPPEDFSHPGTHELFLEARYNGVVSALSTRTDFFLSKSDWMTKPWHNRPKDAIDTAMDALVKLPGMLEAWDMICAQPQTHETLNKVLALTTRCWDMDTELRTWYDNFILMFEGTHPEYVDALRNGLNGPAHQVDLPDILTQAGLHRLYAMTIYWTACTTLFAIMDLIHVKFQSIFDLQVAQYQTANSNILKYCICIALSARYFLKPDLGLSTTLSLSHAGTCLVRTLADHHSCYPYVDKDDVENLKRMMDAVQASGGFDAWVVWKCGMDDLNYNKHEILNYYDNRSI